MATPILFFASKRGTRNSFLSGREKSYERAIVAEGVFVNRQARTKIHDRSNKNIMKTYSYGSHNALILMTMCLLFLSGYCTSQAMSSDAQARRIAVFFFSSRRRHTRCSRDWSSDVCSSD